MLVKGDARARIRTSDVRRLSCSDHLKEIVYRCIGERRKRYVSADELIEALRSRPAPLKPGVRRTLTGLYLDRPYLMRADDVERRIKLLFDRRGLGGSARDGLCSRFARR